MINLTLFVKAFNKGQLQEVTELLQTQFQDLDVSTHFLLILIINGYRLLLKAKMKPLQRRL